MKNKTGLRPHNVQFINWNSQKEAASANELYPEMTWTHRGIGGRDASTAYSGSNSSQGFF